MYVHVHVHVPRYLPRLPATSTLFGYSIRRGDRPPPSPIPPPMEILWCVRGGRHRPYVNQVFKRHTLPSFHPRGGDALARSFFLKISRVHASAENALVIPLGFHQSSNCRPVRSFFLSSTRRIFFFFLEGFVHIGEVWVPTR